MLLCGRYDIGKVQDMAAVNMTEGAIPRRLIGYAVPLVLSNLFQLTYNAVDSMVVGRFVGKEALAAVGTSAPVTNLLVLGISGLCIGAGVIMSEFYGAGDEKQLRKELATAMVGGSVGEQFLDLLLIRYRVCFLAFYEANSALQRYRHLRLVALASDL